MAAAGDARGYYRVLGVERTASAEDIKAAFRRQAKRLHPDRGDGTGDKEAFRLLVEAYEVLRDPQQRLRYDADSLAAQRYGPHPGRTETTGPSPTGRPADGNSIWGKSPIEFALRAAITFLSAQAMPLLLAALVATTAAAVLGWSRAAERAKTVAELTLRLDALSARPSPVVSSSDPSRIYRVNILFPVRAAELDPAIRTRLAGVMGELRRAIRTMPEGGDWLITVEGTIERAADASGLLIDAWELALLRVGVTAQYLVGHGIPADRVAVRFHGGDLAPRSSDAQPHGVTLSLFCCLGAVAGG